MRKGLNLFFNTEQGIVALRLSFVQHPTSWVHSEGMINHSEAFFGCMVVYLEYLPSTRRMLAEDGTVSAGLLEAMQDKANKEMIGQLRCLGYYPIRRKIGKHDWIRKIMNIYPIWITLCRCYHLLPPKLTHLRRLPAASVEGVGGVKHQEWPLSIFKTAEVLVQPPCDSTDCLVKPLELVIHNQSTECFVILLCHSTYAKSYDSKVGLISQKRCIPVTVFAAFLDAGYMRRG